MSKERDDALVMARAALETAGARFERIAHETAPVGDDYGNSAVHESACDGQDEVAAAIRSLKGPSPSPEEPRCAHGRGPVERCLLCEGLAQNGMGNGFSPSPVSGLTLEEVERVRALLEQLAEVATFDAQVPWDENKSPADVAREAISILDGRKAGG